MFFIFEFIITANSPSENKSSRKSGATFDLIAILLPYCQSWFYRV